MGAWMVDGRSRQIKRAPRDKQGLECNRARREVGQPVSLSSLTWDPGLETAPELTRGPRSVRWQTILFAAQRRSVIVQRAGSSRKARKLNHTFDDLLEVCHAESPRCPANLTGPSRVVELAWPRRLHDYFCRGSSSPSFAENSILAFG